MTTTYDTDVLVVGAGPVGIFSVFQAGLLGMKTVVVDSLDEIGGQLTSLYPEKYIYDIPAHPQIYAKDAVAMLEKQASKYKPTYLLSQTTDSLVKNGDIFTITTSKGNTINAKAVIIAAGAGAFGPNKPAVEGLNAYENSSVHYFVKDKNIFKGKDIAIAGGGDSAVDWALTLADIANKIYFIHRRNKFRAAADTSAQLAKLAEEGNKVEMVIPYTMKKLNGENGQLSSIELEKLGGDDKTIECSHLLACFGLARSLGTLKSWGLDIDENLSLVNVASKTCETNIKGIYAVGDVANYEHKIKLILTGFADASQALHHAWQYVFPNKVFHFVHSTSSENS